MFLGLDLGTSGLKSQIIDNNKNVVFENTETFDFIKLGNGATEQDPAVWADALNKTMNKMPQDLKQNILGISFSGQMHGSVFLDKDGNVIRNTILWNDQRTIEETNKLNELFPMEIALNKIGNQFLTGFTAPKVLWLKNNEPDNFNKIHKVVLPKDYLIFLLTGNYASDYSDSVGTAYMNIKDKDWDQDIIKAIGLTKEQLPKLLDSNGLVSSLSADAATKYGINSSANVYAGGGDNPVGAIGLGLVEEGLVSCSFGTSGVVFSPTDTLKVDSQGRTHSFISATGDYYLMGVSLSTGSSVNWLMNNIFESNDFDKYFGKEMYERKISDIIFTPYLNGERTPHFDSNVRGSLLNLSIDHDKIDLSKAVLEGIAFSLKDSLNILKDCGVTPKKILIQGGITKNGNFNQMVSDIFGIEVHTGTSANGPAYGAALIAMSGFNNISLKELAAANMQLGTKYTPNSNNVDVYENKYNMFKDAYSKTK